MKKQLKYAIFFTIILAGCKNYVQECNDEIFMKTYNDIKSSILQHKHPSEDLNKEIKKIMREQVKDSLYSVMITFRKENKTCGTYYYSSEMLIQDTIFLSQRYRSYWNELSSEDPNAFIDFKGYMYAISLMKQLKIMRTCQINDDYTFMIFKAHFKDNISPYKERYLVKINEKHQSGMDFKIEFYFFR